MEINPVLERALESLTLVVVLSRGHADLGDPRERALAHQHFEILWDGGEDFGPQEVVAWASNNGWPSDAARELGEIAQIVLDQPRKELSRKQVRDNVLLEWRKAAASSAPLHPLDIAPYGRHAIRRGDVIVSEG